MKKIQPKGLFMMVMLLVTNMIIAQDLPKFIDISEDQTEIKTEGGEITGFYNESKLRQIYLEFQDANFWSQLEANYDTENYVKATLYYKSDTLYNVGVQFKGNTSYTKLGANDEKMSFSIKTDQFVEGQDIGGYSNINLNNAYEDNSTMKEVVYAHLCRQHIPAPQANFVELFINGEYWGPYTNVQQVNKDLLEEWFLSNDGANFRAIGETASIGLPTGPPTGGGPGGGGGGAGGGGQWGDGTAALNYHDNDSTTYQEYYTLKSSDIQYSWEKLITLCDVLNNTPIDKLEETLQDYMDLDRTLWFLAHEIIYSDDDSYIYKGEMDYYVYYEPETGRMTPLEFDGNSAMDIRNVQWDIFMNEDNVNYPLLNRLMSIPSLRQRYLAHVRTILDQEMNLNEVFTLIDTYAALIDSSIQADPKKLMTYQEYLDGVDELKEYFTTRHSFLSADDEVNVQGIEVLSSTFRAYQADKSLPYANDQVYVTATLATTSAQSVNLYYSNQFVGKFTSVEMFDDGNHQDGTAGDGVYGAVIPGQAEGVYVRYYIEVLNSDATNTATYLPAGAEHHCFIYKVKYDESATSDIVINELMASNTLTLVDGNNEFDDWIELFNRTANPISLEGLYLTDDISNPDKFALPMITLEALDYLIIWADEDGSQGLDHANFKLNADGEELFLMDSLGNVLDQVSFATIPTDSTYARIPNGTGDFAVSTPTPLLNNEGTEITGLNIQNKDFNFVIFPNPISNIMNVQFSQLQKGVAVEILTSNGKVVFEDSSVATDFQIDLSAFPAGIYFVKVANIVRKVQKTN